MALDPSLIPLFDDGSGADAGAPPTGWDEGWWSGESGWKRNGSGQLVPTAGSYRAVATETTATRPSSGSDPEIGFVTKFNTLPISGRQQFWYLGVDPSNLDAFDAYTAVWQRGTDFQIRRYDNASSSLLSNVAESTVSGTITAGSFWFGLAIDSTTVYCVVSTNDGSTWQTITSASDTTYTGALYGGMESNGGTGLLIEEVNFGAQSTATSTLRLLASTGVGT